MTKDNILPTTQGNKQHEFTIFIYQQNIPVYPKKIINLTLATPFSNHIINVHNLKTCPECKTTFSNEEAFNAHLALHPKKEYECGSCNKSFNSVYLLKNHR